MAKPPGLERPAESARLSEVQIRAGVDLQISERRRMLVDAFAVGKFSRIGHALVVGHCELRKIEERRQREMAGDRDDRNGAEPSHAAPVHECREPKQASREPQDERHDDEIFRRRQIHRQQEGKAAQSSAGQIGEIHAAENLVRLEKHGAEIKGAGEKRQHVEHEISEQPPLLHGIGYEEDGVERNLLRQEIRCDGQRPERHQRGRRDAAPVAVEPVFADAHDGTGQAEAQHGEAHHQRAEMRPASDREDSHDANLQRDHGAGFEPDGEIERGRRLEIEMEGEPRELRLGHRQVRAVNSRNRSCTGNRLAPKLGGR
jgi:hypothetical protein